MSTPSSENHPRDDGRPDPEALLTRYSLRDQANTDASAISGPQTEQDNHARGRLRVYLGAVAGVGKTYMMLNEGHRRKERGTDVVIGYVETHNRVQTQAQLRDLEVIPRKVIEYRGVHLTEMDTEAIIARHPALALIDELAHTNVPGAKHPKRYQDVMDILDAGINVVTTLNVQHLESLNDLVTSITGIQVRETLPDRILDQADEVELIDIAPDALRHRMRHGNIYPADRIDAALNNFFREGNLTALRELSLRLTANKTASQLQQYLTEDDKWSITERVLVGFDHRPQSRLIIRDAWRLAHGLNADLIAVSIQPTGYQFFVRRMIALIKYGKNVRKHYEDLEKKREEHALLAEDLGAEVIRRTSSDIAATITELARERHVTQVVLGQPAHTWWEVLLYGSVTNRILRMDADVDIHLVPLTRSRPQTS